MKTKPVSHKSQNTFKFQTFSQQIAQINVNVIHLVGKKEDPERNTFFYETLLKWNELNCTEAYEHFKSDLGVDYQSLAQIFLNKDAIVLCIKKHLQISNSLAYPPLLELIVALANDLEEDFYKYFFDFFVLFLQLLLQKNVEVLEHVFRTIAFLFKILWRYMVNDFNRLYSLYSCLLNDSQPHYIKAFSAESIAFLLRKIPNKDEMLNIIFESVEEDSTFCQGIGLLLFEVVKNVRHEFHSCCEEIFYRVLIRMGTGLEFKTELSWNDAHNCALNMVSSMTKYTTPDFATVLWKTIFRVVDDLSKAYYECDKDSSQHVVEHLGRVLTILNVALSHKEGYLFKWSAENEKKLFSYIKDEWSLSKCGDYIIQFMTTIILSPHVKISSTEKSNIVHSIFQSKYSFTSKWDFTKQLFAYSSFDSDVLRCYLQLCDNIFSGDASGEANFVLSTIAQLIIHFNPLPTTGPLLLKFKSLNLHLKLPNFRFKEKGILEHLERILNLQAKEDEFGAYIPSIWTAVICLPHVISKNNSIPIIERSPFERMEHAHLNDFCSILYNRILSRKANDDEVFLFFCEFTTMLLRNKPGEITETISIDGLIELLKKKPTSIYYLRVIDLYITFMKSYEFEECFNDYVLEKLYPYLEQNLSSPYKEIRLVSLLILNHFKYELPKVETDVEVDKRKNVFELCLMAENIKLTVQDYRERIKILQCLEHNFVQANIPLGNFNIIPLQYLIGTLFEPFEPLWEPCLKLIESHSRGMNKETFWSVFIKHLSDSARIAEERLTNSTAEESNNLALTDDLSNVFKQFKRDFENFSTRVDLVNHRKMLWKVLLRFVDVAESKNRDLSPLLINFMRNEFYRDQLEDAFSQNVECQQNEQKTRSIDLNDDNDEDNLPEDNDNKTNLKYTITLLCSHLLVFSKFKNPKVIYQEQELAKIYFDLLSHPNSAIQKLALDCIMSYKHSFLLPYKDNLYKLIDEKTFKSEIVVFNINTDVSVIQEMHRTNLMPFLMSILFGLMQKKQGKKSSGKRGFIARRNIILQYLANSKEDEFDIFLDLIFKPLRKFINGSILNLVENVFLDIDLTNVIPMKKVEKTLHLIGVILEKFGGKILSHLNSILKVLIYMTARIFVLVEHRESVHPKYLRHLKILKRLALTTIIQFFTTFDNYPFNKDEIDALFSACIWPQLKRLPQEGVRDSIPLLLQLFFHWSENSRYFPLLAKHHKENDNFSPLFQIMELLSNGNTSQEVVDYNLKIIKNLLTMADFVPDFVDEEFGDKSGPIIEVNDGFKFLENVSRFDNWKERPNYGSLILLPHTHSILHQLQKSIDTMGKKNKNAIPETNLIILNRLSEFIDDGDFCANLVKMIIPFLTKKLRRNEEMEIRLFSTMIHLFKVANDPIQFVNQLCLLFSTLENRGSRVALCEAFNSISERDETNIKCSSLAAKLNAWDSRRAEEPDYLARIEGFQEIKNITSIDLADTSYLLVIIYNCCYSIRTISDLAIRDNASYCLQQLALKFSLVSTVDIGVVSKQFIQPLLNEVKRGLQNKNENVRNEFISVLAAFCRVCRNFSQFNDLHLLTDSDVDVDYFENIRHIQMHRRSRAMSKLVNGDLLKRLNQNTLIKYIMPITSAFLFNETYIKYNHLVDSSIELIGKVCHHLDWKMYEKYLSFYLAKVTDSSDFQKMAVSTVVSILNAFHFDLSSLGNYAADKLIAPPVADIVTKKDEDMDIDDDDEVEDHAGNESKSASLEKATKIYNAVTISILPQLHKCITRKTAKDDDHRLANNYRSDEDEVLRVPVAIAMIKLLQRMPNKMLDTHLPGVLMKLCNFLKSRLASVRQIARQTLLTVTESLGAKYIPYVIKEMRQLLTRGYQVHSMTFAIHALLRHMIPHYKTGSLDNCVGSLISIFRNELFGAIAEEKEIDKISGKLVEAKGTKAYDVYEIMARFISSSHMVELISSLRETLSETTNHTIVSKTKECLKRVVFGFVQNEALTSNHILIFSYEVIKNVLEETKAKEIKAKEQKSKVTAPSIFIVPPEPRRNKVKAPKSLRTNIHVLTEFGLEVLYFGFKRDKIDISSQEALERIDPFVSIVIDYLNSSHIELVINSLKILNWLLKLDLPTLSTSMPLLTRTLFTILRKYSSGTRYGAGGEDIVGTCFKTIIVLIKNMKSITIEENHLKTLLMYIDRDVNDSSKQSLSFNMLKAILSKQLIVPEIHEIMKTLEKMSITSETEHIRHQCRQCVFKYLLDYPINKQEMDFHLQFYVAQLNYEHESGRESAIEMLDTICSTFPQTMLNPNASTFFVAFAKSLANEESELCCKMIAAVIKKLITMISVNEKNTLFSMVESWYAQKKINIRKLANQLCGLFVEVEKTNFRSRLASILTLMLKDFRIFDGEQLNSEQQKYDHLYIQMLQTLAKIFKECEIIRDIKYQTELDGLWECLNGFLLHSHSWIKLLTSRLFGFLFAAHPIKDVWIILSSDQQPKSYLFNDFPKKIFSLVNNFFKQLKSSVNIEDLSEQIAKNMIYLAQVIDSLPIEFLKLEVENRKRTIENAENENNKKQITLSINWLFEIFSKEAGDEIRTESKLVVRRTCFFQWIAALCLKLDKVKFIENSHIFFPRLKREIDVDVRYTDENLKTLAQEVLDCVKEKLGLEEFSKQYALAQRLTSEKNAKRKMERTAQAVVNPARAAKRKISKNLLKAGLKRRKIDHFREHKGRPTKRTQIRKT